MVKNKEEFGEKGCNPQAGGSSPLCASHDFVDACSSARKAWHRTNLLAISKPATIGRVKQSMIHDNATVLKDLLLDIMGPVAPITPKDAMGSASVGHREMAGLICLSAMRIGCLVRKKGDMIDLELIKNLLLSWIDFGEFRFSASISMKGIDEAVASAKGMGLVFSSVNYPDRVRLAVVAPLAPALESMIVISILSDSVVKMMSKTADHVAEIKVMTDDLIEATDSNSSPLVPSSSMTATLKSKKNNPFSYMTNFLSRESRKKKFVGEA